MLVALAALLTKDWIRVAITENQEGMGEANMPASTQSIISITPAQWEQLAQVTGRDEPLLGHRS